MSVADFRSELEEDLAWRLDELRHLRNALLGDLQREDWPVTALRAILVMQYAHLEGFARNAFSIYVNAVNERRLLADEAHPHLFASALIPEFDALRRGANPEQAPNNEPDSEHGRLTKRALVQVEFVQKLRDMGEKPLSINVESAVSMEMNFGSDVLRRTLYRLGIPEEEVARTYYNSLEFVRKMRNDIAHGSRRERIPPGEFEAHQRKCEAFMGELVRLITMAIGSEWFRKQGSVTA